MSSELQKNAEKFFGTESDENLISLCDYFVAALSPAAAELKLRLVAEGKETGWKSREEECRHNQGSNTAASLL